MVVRAATALGCLQFPFLARQMIQIFDHCVVVASHTFAQYRVVSSSLSGQSSILDDV